MEATDNVNPEVFLASAERSVTEDELDEDKEDLFDSREVFDILRSRSK